MAYKIIKAEATTTKGAFNVIVPDEHVGDSVAEAVDDLASKLVKAQKSGMADLVEAVKNITLEQPKDTKYRFVISRDKEGRISEIETSIVK